jgi:rSAM/selenodomain-associated transferase 1
MAENRCVVLFTKPARAGRVKTRLIGDLTPDQAAELHAAFLADVLERLQRGSFHLQIAWAMDTDEALPESTSPGFRQTGEDLGERLLRGLRRVARDYPFVAAVGSDHPDLPIERLGEAFARLAEGADVVLGPAQDGGYYLIAVSRQSLGRTLFSDIPWSTGRVLEATLERCRQQGLSVDLLTREADVDTPADLERLAASLAARPADCPRTQRLLASWGRMG